MHSLSRFSRAGFTLIELLIVIAIIAIISIVVVLVLNPAQLLMQSRDSNRVSDMASLNSALNIYSAQGGSSLGNVNTVYVSIPDPLATSTAGDQCQGLGLSPLPASDTYFCASPGNYRNVNGTGWIPVNLTTLAGGSPLGQVPVDPVNQSSTSLYYTYATNGSQFVVTSMPESQQYKTKYQTNPSIPNFPGIIAQGSNLAISPLFSSASMLGYWPLDEGSGSSTADASGNGHTGTWNGTPTGTAGAYYSSGKVGNYSGDFDGNTDYINLGTSPSLQPTAAMTLVAWIKINSYPTQLGIIAAVAQGSTPWAVALYKNDGGYTGFGVIMNGGGYQSITDISSPVPVTGQWIQIAFTWNGTSGVVYENGVGLPWTPATTLSSGSGPVDIGWDGTWSKFNGQIDDFREYGRALSSAEILGLYNSEK